jgi:ketosteroid isomerase-like protein
VSQQNIEIQRRLTDAFNARDIEAFIAYCDPDIEFHALLSTTVGGAIYHGHDGLRAWHRDTEEAWGEEVRLEREAIFDLREQTLVYAVLHGRGSQSGAVVAMPHAQVLRWKNGRCVYFKAYVRREDALEDLGVSEDALVPIAP